MANKSVNDFVKDLVESPSELPIWPSDWSGVPEQYVEEDNQAQDEGKTEEE